MEKEKFFIVYSPRSFSAGADDIICRFMFEGLKFYDTLQDAEKNYTYWQEDGTNTIIKQTIDNQFFGRNEGTSDYHTWYKINIYKKTLEDTLKSYCGRFEERCELLVSRGISPDLLPKTDPYIEYTRGLSHAPSSIKK